MPGKKLKSALAMTGGGFTTGGLRLEEYRPVSKQSTRPGSMTPNINFY
jgi:hypothetical protein